jgi:cation:H+ antiporter
VIGGYLVAGGLLLFLGGDSVVRGGSKLARLWGISPLVVGLTIIAFGTSLPELLVSLLAALRGKEAIAVGNVIGSNIANIGLILGLSGSLFLIVITTKRVRKDLNYLLAVSVLFSIMLLDGVIQRWEGIALFGGIIIYSSYCIITGREKKSDDGNIGSIPGNLFIISIGIISLTGGAHLFVEGAMGLAAEMGMDKKIDMAIGLTVAAYGTSLPELATSLVAAYKKESEISLGNIIGSNMFNILAVIGLVSAISPLKVDPSVTHFEIPVMLLYVLLLYPLLRKTAIPRIYAFLMLSGYVAFIVFVFIRALSS